MKIPKTGGGPQPPEPSQAEVMVLALFDGRPSLDGLSTFVDASMDPIGTPSNVYLHFEISYQS